MTSCLLTASAAVQDECDRSGPSFEPADLRLGFLPARRYTSAGTSRDYVFVRVCLSQVGVLLKMEERIELLSTYPTLCSKEIEISTKYGYFPLELFFPHSGLRENFASKHIVDLARERWTLRA